MELPPPTCFLFFLLFIQDITETYSVCKMKCDVIIPATQRHILRTTLRGTFYFDRVVLTSGLIFKRARKVLLMNYSVVETDGLTVIKSQS